MKSKDLEFNHELPIKVTNKGNLCPTCDKEIPLDWTQVIEHHGNTFTFYHIGCEPLAEVAASEEE